MFNKLAFSQSVLQSLAGQKTAASLASKIPVKRLLAGGALGVGAYHVATHAPQKAHEYHAGFSPGPEELMNKVAEVAPAKFAFFIKTAEEVKESPFREEIVGALGTIMEKAAFSMNEMGKSFGNVAGGIGATVATGIAYSLAGDMFDALKRGITKSRNYKAMLNANPDLKELPAQDVQKAFSALHRFNPDFASEPTVAGSFVRRSATLQEFDPKMLTELVGARKNLSDLKKLPMPGKLPWESREEKGLRSAQTSHFENSAAKAKQEMEHGKKMHPEQLRGQSLKNMLSEDQVASNAANGISSGKLTVRQRKLLGL